jgi:hypothetical protein
VTVVVTQSENRSTEVCESDTDSPVLVPFGALRNGQ